MALFNFNDGWVYDKFHFDIIYILSLVNPTKEESYSYFIGFLLRRNVKTITFKLLISAICHAPILSTIEIFIKIHVKMFEK